MNVNDFKLECYDIVGVHAFKNAKLEPVINDITTIIREDLYKIKKIYDSNK